MDITCIRVRNCTETPTGKGEKRERDDKFNGNSQSPPEAQEGQKKVMKGVNSEQEIKTSNP